MISRRDLLATSAVTGAALTGLPGYARAATPDAPARDAGTGEPPADGHDGLRVTGTTVEYASGPLGLDVERPRLSWVLAADHCGRRQSAYQVRVATDPGRLADPDVWDSGRRASQQSLLVEYDGPALRPRTRYHWSVRVWDERGTASAWSAQDWWETGLTGPAGDGRWQARWVAAPAAVTAAVDLSGARWIWFPEGDPTTEAPAATRYFRGTVRVDGAVRGARLALAADDGFTAWLNGTEIASREPLTVAKSWSRPATVDVTDFLRPGDNALAVAATNAERGPAGLLATLELTTHRGTTRWHTGGDWRTTDTRPTGQWQDPGYDDSGWRAAEELADWGGGPWGKVLPEPPPAQLRRAFRIADSPVVRARLYATALGLYEARLNGDRVGRDELTPGWTDYHRRVSYQTYDVTDAVRPGENALGVTLAPGWYAGNVAWLGQHQYGDRPALLLQLEVEHADGSTERVTTDTHWRAATGPLLTADLLMGEQYDARRETPGWDAPGFDDTGWRQVEPVTGVTAEVTGQTEAPTRVEQELSAVAVTEPAPGTYVYDLGQNMVGNVRLRISGPAGTRIQLRHGEVLDHDGSLYTANLRTARAADTFVLAGTGAPETYQPRFTSHGFRYVEVTGAPHRPPRDAVTGRVMHTAAPSTMTFHTGDDLLDRLHSHITWGQRGNFLAIPTDTPARDERLGWTGDINVFSETATYTMESARFLTAWLRSLREGQAAQGAADPDATGAFPDVAPVVSGIGAGTAGWGDAGVTVPWNLYQAYGDRRVLRENWPAMRAWITYLTAHSTDLLRPAEGYGDWLNVDDETPKDVIGTAYFAHATDLVGRAARALGEDPGPYTTLLARIRRAFAAAYVSSAGRVKGDTQTGYVLALAMDLLPTAATRRAAADRLVELIEARDWHLSTGFLGTPLLLPVLTAAGRTDVAYRLLTRRSYPSWGYQIDRGATTMWERWDGIKPDGSFEDVSMNSFNHYAYGSVGAWMYQNITGIAPGSPGFRHVVVRPRPGGGLRGASGRFDSRYGPISTTWALHGGRYTLDVALPPNVTAEVWVASAKPASASGPGARRLRTEDGCAVFAVDSGRYRFSAVAPGP